MTFHIIIDYDPFCVVHSVYVEIYIYNIYEYHSYIYINIYKQTIMYNIDILYIF